MPHLARIVIYPVKSFDGIAVEEAKLLPSGALEHDRQFALFDGQGQILNAKRTPRFHLLRTALDPAVRSLTLMGSGTQRQFQLDADRAALDEWLSRFFGLAVRLEENEANGFPDDTLARGPTVISSATLSDVTSWFDGLSLADIQRRFRANLEIDGVEPFWEDKLYSEEGRGVRFQIGQVLLEGTNPCQRCVVPTRSPETGLRYDEFAAVFEARRYETLPDWATRSRFDHFYRLAVNTRPVAGNSGTIHVGDAVSIID